LHVSRLWAIVIVMDKTIRSYKHLDEMKADEYRAWQKLPPHARLDAAAELSISLYQLKEPSKNVPTRLQRTLVHLKRPKG